MLKLVSFDGNNALKNSSFLSFYQFSWVFPSNLVYLLNPLTPNWQSYTNKRKIKTIIKANNVIDRTCNSWISFFTIIGMFIKATNSTQKYGD